MFGSMKSLPHLGKSDSVAKHSNSGEVKHSAAPEEIHYPKPAESKDSISLRRLSSSENSERSSISEAKPKAFDKIKNSVRKMLGKQPKNNFPYGHPGMQNETFSTSNFSTSTSGFSTKMESKESLIDPWTGAIKHKNPNDSPMTSAFSSTTSLSEKNQVAKEPNSGPLIGDDMIPVHITESKTENPAVKTTEKQENKDKKMWSEYLAHNELPQKSPAEGMSATLKHGENPNKENFGQAYDYYPRNRKLTSENGYANVSQRGIEGHVKENADKASIDEKMPATPTNLADAKKMQRNMKKLNEKYNAEYAKRTSPEEVEKTNKLTGRAFAQHQKEMKEITDMQKVTSGMIERLDGNIRSQKSSALANDKANEWKEFLARNYDLKS